MAYVRILIDGYSLLHRWPALAAEAPRHSEIARDELIHLVTRYQDIIHTPISVIFDGGGAPPDVPKPHSTPAMEVLYSPRGATADDLIERVACRLEKYGRVLVVTDDSAERETVQAFGAHTVGCADFIADVERALEDQGKAIVRFNRWERERFKRHR